MHRGPLLRYPIVLSIAALLFVTAVERTDAQANRPTGCRTGAAAHRSHSRLGACSAPEHRTIVETTYYQNASRVGGTALAAYPEARVRYGIASNVELFYDSPSEIAKSGLHGSGIYVMQHSGSGANVELGRRGDLTYSLSAEIHPPLNALANLRFVPRDQADFNATWMSSTSTEFAAQVGAVAFQTPRFGRARGDAATSALAATRALNRKTTFTAELETQSRALYGALAQTSAVASVQRSLSRHLLTNVELGTAFNAAGNSKPHYLGAGFSLH
jgi:hypothetical protein